MALVSVRREAMQTAFNNWLMQPDLEPGDAIMFLRELGIEVDHSPRR